MKKTGSLRAGFCLSKASTGQAGGYLFENAPD